jgi:hypothetical protein
MSAELAIRAGGFTKHCRVGRQAAESSPEVYELDSRILVVARTVVSGAPTQELRQADDHMAHLGTLRVKVCIAYGVVHQISLMYTKIHEQTTHLVPARIISSHHSGPKIY